MDITYLVVQVKGWKGTFTEGFSQKVPDIFQVSHTMFFQ